MSKLLPCPFCGADTEPNDILCGSIAIGAKLEGWYWIIPVIGVPAALYGMWRVGGWE